MSYPWTKSPLVVSAPMRLISTPALAVAVSRAGGLGFLAAGNDVTELESHIAQTRALFHLDPRSDSPIPIGIGFLLWGAPLDRVTALLAHPLNRPAAVWLFAPHAHRDLITWIKGMRRATGPATKIWVQLSSVAEATAILTDPSSRPDSTDCTLPDVLVVQSQDAGGHNATQTAGLLPLLPEISLCVTRICQRLSLAAPPLIAAGGIADGPTAAGALGMGAHGLCAGTAYLASPEARVAPGYRAAVVRASDGGTATVRMDVYDRLRGTTAWPRTYTARGLVNASYTDSVAGMDEEENRRLYVAAATDEDTGWDEGTGRLTAYAGTGVGLVNRIEDAELITRRLREEGVRCLLQSAKRVEHLVQHVV